MSEGHPGPASHSFKPKLGQREYRGYCEWAVHPLEAELVLSRGYAIVDGIRRPVLRIHDEEFCVQIFVGASDPALAGHFPERLDEEAA